MSNKSNAHQLTAIIHETKEAVGTHRTKPRSVDAFRVYGPLSEANILMLTKYGYSIFEDNDIAFGIGQRQPDGVIINPVYLSLNEYCVFINDKAAAMDSRIFQTIFEPNA